MARILFLTQVLPYPLDAGPKVRAYHMIQHLARCHEITLASFVRADDPPEAVDHLRTLCRAVYTVPMRRAWWRTLRAAIKGALTGLPGVIVRDEVGEMADLLLHLADQIAYDVVHADQLSMAGYGLHAARGGKRAHTLLDEHNAVYLLARRLAAAEPQWWRRVLIAREARALARYEARMCNAYQAILAVTAQDRARLLDLITPAQRAAVAAKITVVPISVDTASVAPIEHRPLPDAAPMILYVGTMFWPPNVAGVLWFARAVLPMIHQHLPTAHFVIVGKAPPPAVQALAADARIKVVGYVADLTPYLEAADVFVVPLHSGSGMRVKILDAWQWGLPVVTTTVGVEGIDTSDNTILIADSESAFADAILRLLSDPVLNARMRRAGRAWVESHYSWQAVYSRVDEVYARLLNDRS